MTSLRGDARKAPAVKGPSRARTETVKVSHFLPQLLLGVQLPLHRQRAVLRLVHLQLQALDLLLHHLHASRSVFCAGGTRQWPAGGPARSCRFPGNFPGRLLPAGNQGRAGRNEEKRAGRTQEIYGEVIQSGAEESGCHGT